MSDEIYLVCLDSQNIIGTKKQIVEYLEDSTGYHVFIEIGVLYLCERELNNDEHGSSRDIIEHAKLQTFTDLRAS